MELGVMWRLNPREIEADFKRLKSIGFDCCHLSVPDPGTYEQLDPVGLQVLATRCGMQITAIWCGLGQPCRWNLVEGPTTVGLVPEAYRQARLDVLAACGRFCRHLGVRQVITHVGFIPEDESLPLYDSTVETLRQAARSLDDNDCLFLLETGQETPVTLRRALEDMACDNAGVNLDTGNLVMYGRGDPVGAIDMLGNLIKSVHAKDGKYPTGGRIMGEETPCGSGRVRFDEVISSLRQIGFTGDFMIEREIEGEQKIIDIIQARQMLLRLI